MRIFLSFVGLAFLVFLLSFFLVGRRPEVSEVVESLPEVDVVDEYDYGYGRGRASFLRQMGRDVPNPPAARYMTSDGHEKFSEEEMRGYVDGYHRAAESFDCPRGG